MANDIFSKKDIRFSDSLTSLYETDYSKLYPLLYLDYIVKKYISKKFPKSQNSSWETKIYDDDLLICRESHLWTKGDFREEFQKLFNENSELLYWDDNIFGFYGDEKDSQAFKEILCHKINALSDFDKIENDYKVNKSRRGAVKGNKTNNDINEETFDVEEFIREKEDMEEELTKSVENDLLLKFVK